MAHWLIWRKAFPVEKTYFSWYRRWLADLWDFWWKEIIIILDTFKCHSWLFQDKMCSLSHPVCTLKLTQWLSGAGIFTPCTNYYCFSNYLTTAHSLVWCRDYREQFFPALWLIKTNHFRFDCEGKKRFMSFEMMYLNCFNQDICQCSPNSIQTQLA